MSKQEPLPFVVGSDTSREAAESLVDALPQLQSLVYGFIRGRGLGGATCDEVEVGLGLRHQTASARVYELANKGLIIDSGLRRRTRSGRRAAVYVATGVGECKR